MKYTIYSFLKMFLKYKLFFADLSKLSDFNSFLKICQETRTVSLDCSLCFSATEEYKPEKLIPSKLITFPNFVGLSVIYIFLIHVRKSKCLVHYMSEEVNVQFITLQAVLYQQRNDFYVCFSRFLNCNKAKKATRTSTVCMQGCT